MSGEPTSGHVQEITLRELEDREFELVREIDRTERIDAIYVQQGTRLELRSGDFSAPAWRKQGTGGHSVAGQVAAIRKYVQAGAIALGAFDTGRLVGIGVVTPHLRPTLAQLAYLHVSAGHRGRGIGSRLATELESIARRAGDTAIVVSATPSVSTVRFYEAHGFRPLAEPLAELYALEPEDVHMAKALA